MRSAPPPPPTLPPTPPKACLTVMRLFIYQAANGKTRGDALKCDMLGNFQRAAAFQGKLGGVKMILMR